MSNQLENKIQSTRDYEETLHHSPADVELGEEALAEITGGGPPAGMAAGYGQALGRLNHPISHLKGRGKKALHSGASEIKRLFGH